MSVFRFESVQLLPISLDEAWEFFSSPQNLKTITPEYMGFHILSGADRKMFPGQIIQYHISPFPGIKMRWVTEITHVIDKSYFVDEQRFGPYAFWHHKHFFRAIPGGVEMIDIVDYKLPMGILGKWMQPWMVKPRLEAIFAYRTEKLDQLFGKMT